MNTELQFPIFITGMTQEQQYDKVLEEVREFVDELKKEKIKHEDLFSEGQDIIQSLISLMVSRAIDITSQTDDAYVKVMVNETLKYFNHLHNKKMDKYKSERGWR